METWLTGTIPDPEKQREEAWNWDNTTPKSLCLDLVVHLNTQIKQLTFPYTLTWIPTETHERD